MGVIGRRVCRPHNQRSQILSHRRVQVRRRNLIGRRALARNGRGDEEARNQPRDEAHGLHLVCGRDAHRAHYRVSRGLMQPMDGSRRSRLWESVLGRKQSSPDRLEADLQSRRPTLKLFGSDSGATA